MGLLFADGMDLIGNTAHIADRYDSVGSSITYGSSNGRFGGGGIKVADDDTWFSKGTPDTVTTIISFAVYRSATVETSTDRVWVFQNGTNFGGIEFRNVANSGDMTCRRGNTILGTFSLSQEAWHWVSIKWLADASTGTIDVEVDGTNVFSFSGNTVNDSGGGEYCSTCLFGSTRDNDFTYDDIIICDDTGSAPFNDLLADRRIDTIVPNGVGTDSDFTPVSGANWTNVDEVPPDDDTSYVESNTANDSDLYAMENAPAGVASSIDAVQVTALARNPDGGTAQLKLQVEQNASVAQGSSISLGSDYQYIVSQFYVDPDTAAAWTTGGIDTMEAGMELV